ncbi:MAG: type II secretion system F family protein [Proteobacteria bacterium]|nr:type II secretion system F family protein [Pseudomonadota bacterium]MBW3617089.1 type II secretion system F family protein [Pseudomonadota bacterium]
MDASAAFFVLVFAAIFTLAQGLWGLMRVGVAKRKVNHRLKVVDRLASLADMVVELRKERGLAADGSSRLKWPWLAQLVVRSGLVYHPRRWTLTVAGMALGAAVLGFAVTRNPWGAVAGAVLGSTAVPILFLKFVGGQREAKLVTQLPNALEVVVRSLEAGHPVPTAIALVGREMADPIGSEFGMAADEIAFGSTLEQAIGRMADRCKQVDVDLFAATVRLQERSGGNLVGLLKMNARTVRERTKMRLKIKAASSEARVSAMILTAAPFAVGLMLQVLKPDFYGEVIHERTIHVGLAGLGVWMVLGILVMQRMVNFKI